MYLNRKTRFFNMIEVLLALGVIAIGMTSILGLFPVGLNASRNAIAENCSSDVADQMTTYLKAMNELDDGTLYTANFVGVSSKYNSNKLDATITETLINSESTAFLTAYKAGNTAAANFPRVATGWSVFERNTTPDRMFFIVQGPNCTVGSGPVDYSAMAIVWKSPVQIKHVKLDGDPAVPAVWESWPLDSDVYSDYPTNTVINQAKAYDYSAKLNIELSWPLVLPYSERKKRYYQIVITKP